MKVYFAGFDVFRPDAHEHYSGLCEEAQRLNLVPLTPLDADPPVEPIGPAAAKRIFASNLVKLGQADALIANLAPFRGQEPDSGTVFEVGYAIARGIPVIGYGVPNVSYAERVGAAIPCSRSDEGVFRESENGWIVEDFGLPLNLMLSCSIEFRTSATEALQALAFRTG